MLLYVEAPFASFRTFSTGAYRPTATFATPSAAYGLILNVAGVESRLYEHHANHGSSAPATLIKQGLHDRFPVKLALGAPDAGSLAKSLPTVQTIFQQLHSYPVGKDAGTAPELAKGNKNHIAPVRREFLCNVRCYICLKGNAILEERIRRGLNGEFNGNRYGIPFLGDNNFLLDRLHIVSDQDRRDAYWYEVVADSVGLSTQPHSTRVTTTINRADMSGTVSRFFCPKEPASLTPPERAWVQFGQSANQA